MPPPTTNHSPEKAALAAALRELERALRLFTQALAHHGGPVSAEHATGERDARRRLVEAYSTIDYATDDPALGAPVCLGVAGATAVVIDRAEAVNAAKAELRAECAPLRSRRVRIPVKDGEGRAVVKSLPLVRVILRELQRSDLNLVAAYRKIPILTGRPARIAYTRAHTRAVYRKTRAEIIALLAASDRPGAEEDRERVLILPARETHLALVKEHYTNIRANVTFHGLDARHRGRTQVSAELPLLYPQGRSTELPEIAYPSDTLEAAGEGASARARRPRTGKLEDTAFLGTLTVYRYRPTSRRAGR